MILSRRRFVAGALAAPFIARAASLMPVRALVRKPARPSLTISGMRAMPVVCDINVKSGGWLTVAFDGRNWIVLNSGS